MTNLKSRPNSKKKRASSKGFSDFFLHSSDEEMNKVFVEVARRACKDQRQVIAKYGAK